MTVWIKTPPSEPGKWGWALPGWDPGLPWETVDIEQAIGGELFVDDPDFGWRSLEDWIALNQKKDPLLWTDRPIPEPKENERKGERRSVTLACGNNFRRNRRLGNDRRAPARGGKENP